jgi:hypothetical protein
VKRPVKRILAFALAIGLTILITSVQSGPSVVSRAEAQAAPQPEKGQGKADPKPLDPKSLPVVAGPASASQEGKDVPVMSPDPQARKAAQEGRGPQAAAGERSKAPTGEAAPGANPPAVNFAFNGQQRCTGDAAFCWDPPDQALAVGPNHVFEANNQKLTVFDKNGVAVLGPTSLQSWFGYASTASLFDPVAIFRNGHFYLVALFVDSGTGTSTINLSVSQTNQANGGWCNYFLNGKLGNSWADFPKLGASVDLSNQANSRILIGTNQFDFSTGGFTNNFVQELPKQALDACAGFSYTNWFSFTDANDNSTLFTPVPVLSYDNDGNRGWSLMATRFGSGSGITVWRNVFGTGFVRDFVDTINYSNPPGATQPTTATRIDTVDDRLQSAVRRYGKTWAIHTTALGGCGAGNDTANPHLFQINTPINAASSLVAVSGPLGGAGTRDAILGSPCGTHLYNASVSHDANGNALFIYNQSGNSEFINPRMGGWHIETGLSFGNLVGAANPGFVNTTGRNGDYSAVALDSLDQRFVWGAVQIELANNSWGTRIGRLILSANAI